METNLSKKRTAIIWGSTGLIGSELKKMLLNDNDYTLIICPVRKPSGDAHSKLKEIIFDFDSFIDKSNSIVLENLQANHVFITLGTTIKKAGSAESFRKVDYDYCLLAGQIAESTQAEVLSLVTAIGSEPRSAIFYNRVKGEIEEEISKLNIPNIQIFRPSLLLGDRKEFRIGEKLAEIVSLPISFLMLGNLKKYKPIQAKTVASAMLKQAVESKKEETKKVQFFEGEEISL